MRFLSLTTVLTCVLGCGEPAFEVQTQSQLESRDSNTRPDSIPLGELKSDGFASANEGEDGHAADSCVITLCLTGAMNHETPSNVHFRNLCADPRIKGLHRDCAFGQCNGTFDSFLQFPLLTVYPVLVDALVETVMGDRSRRSVCDAFSILMGRGECAVHRTSSGP